MSDALSAKAVLEYLDGISTDDFPAFDNLNFPFVSGRLNVYRSEHSWAIVLCILANFEDLGIMTMIFPLSPLAKMSSWSQHIDSEDFDDPGLGIAIDGVNDVEDILADYFDPKVQEELKKATALLNQKYQQFQEDHADEVSDDDTFIETAQFDFDDEEQLQAISIRGKAVGSTEIKLLKEYLQKQGISENEAFIKEKQKIWGISREEVIEYLSIRLLCEKIASRYKEQLLPTQEEIEIFFPQGLPPLFLSLDAWYHPDWSAEEPLSQCETFKLLARAIESGCKEDYAPTLKPNTNWREWTED